LEQKERIIRIVRTGETVCPPRPEKALLLGLHRRPLAPHGAIRMIRFIRSNPHPVVGFVVGIDATSRHMERSA
jgi:hypothetical protein